MGELHLEIIVDRMMREFSVQANVGKPQVAYRETIRKEPKAKGRTCSQSGGRGQYGMCDRWSRRAGKGYEFANDIFGGSIPKNSLSRPMSQYRSYGRRRSRRLPNGRT